MELGLIDFMDSGATARSEDPLSAQNIGTEALASLLEASLDGIVVLDDKWRYLFANPAACQILGVSRDEMAERDLLMAFPERERAAMLLHIEETVQGRPGRWITTLLRPDGEEREIECSSKAISVGGRL